MTQHLEMMKLLVLCLAISMIGCGWKDMEGWSSYAVWSDDDTAVVGVYEYFEGKNTVTHLKKRSIKSEVYLMPYGAHDGEPRLLMPQRAGRIDKLFFMSSAGYLIVNREDRLEELDDGMNQMSQFSVDKVSLDGTVESLGSRQALTMISCDAEGQSATTTGEVVTAYPSPDGGLIARVETNTTCQRQTATITFLDAETLSAIGEPFSTSHTVGQQLGITDYSWLENGRFAQVTSSFRGPEGNSYAPNTEPENISSMPYDCFFPATTSSDTNAAGSSVSTREGVVEVSNSEHGQATFGCP